MRRAMCLVLTFVMLIGLMPLTVFAQTSEAVVAEGVCGADGDNVTWALHSTGLLEIQGNGAIKNYPMEEGAPWVDYREKILTVKIGFGVTGIGNEVFWECSQLIGVTIAETVTYIGAAAFRGCRSLTQVTIPAGVTEIGKAAFGACVNLSDVYYGGSQLQWAQIRIGSDNEALTDATIHCAAEETIVAGGNCGEALTWSLLESGLLCIQGSGSMPDYSAEDPAPWQTYSGSISKVAIYSGVTDVGAYAFAECEALTGAVIPDTVSGIGGHSFMNCTGLVEIAIPDSVKRIDWGAFSGCDSLETFIVPNSVTEIGTGAFWNCENLKEVILGSGLTGTGVQVFSGCGNLEQVTICFGVRSIDVSSFENCVSLTEITIPDTITAIDTSAFGNCISLNDVHFAGTGMQWSNVTVGADNEHLTGASVHFEGDTVLAGGNCGMYEDVIWTMYGSGLLHIQAVRAVGTMKDYPMELGAPWKKYRKDILKVVIGPGVENIGDNGFYNCANLTDITLPDTVDTIGRGAFAGCSSLKEITISENVTVIGDVPFSGCAALQRINVESGNKNYSCDGQGALYNKDKTVLIAVPGAGEAFEIPETVTRIEKFAFNSCVKLTQIKIPESVSEIGENAFAGCANVTSINIPKAVTVIESGTFMSCGKLTTVTIPKGVAVIEDNAFARCGELTAITIGGSVTEIKGYAFYGCGKLADVYFGGSQEKWDKISTGNGNEALTGATIHFQGESIPGDLDGNGSVDDEDVIYLLWHTLMADEYPVDQNVDFDQNGSVDDEDVIYLLWHTLMPKEYPL